MNNTHTISTHYAIAKAKEAVESWKAGLAQAKAENASPADIRFCEESLAKCEARLAWVRNDVEVNWTAYI